MKKHLLIFLCLALAVPLYTEAQSLSNLILFTENGEKFTVTVNGEKRNESASSRVKVEGLKGDFHQILVEFEEKELGVVSQNFVLDPGTEQKAQITMKKNGKWAIRPFGEPVPLDQVVKAEPTPAVREEYRAEPSETPAETVVTTTTTRPDGAGESIDMQIGVGGESIGVSVKVNDGSIHQSTTTTVAETRSATSPAPAETMVQVDGCTAMADADFKDALHSLKAKTFSDSRMTQAKQILKSNCMSAEQIKMVMGAFEYEDDKLEFAKAAYDRCADPENYWKVNDAFEFEMTIDELNEYIESK